MRIAVEAELDIARRRLDEQTAKAENAVKELSIVKSEHGIEVSQLRAELKLKSFELSSLGASFEVD